VVTTGALSHAKLQSIQQYQQINTQPDAFLLPNQQCQSTVGNKLLNNKMDNIQPSSKPTELTVALL